MRIVVVDDEPEGRAQVELALRRELARDSIFLLENDRFVEYNSSTREMFRCQPDEILGRSPFDFSPAVQPDGSTSRERADELEALRATADILGSAIHLGRTPEVHDALSRTSDRGDRCPPIPIPFPTRTRRVLS